MPVVYPITNGGWQDVVDGKSMLALGIRGRVGRPSGFGASTIGWTWFGNPFFYGGVYQRRVSGYNNLGRHDYLPRKTYWVRMKHSHPNNPRTVEQQAWRSKFTEAMDSWKNLTSEEKQVIIKKATRAGRRPHNYYVSEYLRNLAN